MKFKVGDMVRFTREYMGNNWYTIFDTHQPIITGSKIDSIEGQKYIINYKDRPEEALELVPEEPEFEEGEMIEVFAYEDKIWKKKIFISKIPGNVGCPYACVHGNKIDEYKKGYSFEVELWKTARKLRPQLTRAEIAEKFGVSKDFTLLD